jgi:hypothetical protein
MMSFGSLLYLTTPAQRRLQVKNKELILLRLRREKTGYRTQLSNPKFQISNFEFPTAHYPLIRPPA